MNWNVTSASTRGSSHQRSGRPNQDASAHFAAPSADGLLRAVLAVSDGHGGARHFRSQTGSRLAADTTVRVVCDAVGSLDRSAAASELDNILQALVAQILADWRAAIAEDLEANPLTDSELAKVEEAEGATARASVEAEPVLAYGATLLIVIAAESFLAYLQLGDGDILAVDSKGETTRPLPGDERLIGNQTTSLCQPDAWRDFRVATVIDPAEFPAAIFASTDGYSNSFQSEAGFLQIGRDYLNMIREQGLDSLAKELPEILADASGSGSGDDITLGILVNESALKKIALAEPKPRVEKTVAVEPKPAPPGAEPPKPAAVQAEPPAASHKPKNVAAAKPSPRPAQPAAKPSFTPQQWRVMIAVLAILGGVFAVARYGSVFGLRPDGDPSVAGGKPVSIPVTGPVTGPVSNPPRAAAPAKEPKSAPEVPADGQVYALQATGGKTLSLTSGRKLRTSEVLGLLTGKATGGSAPYAEVGMDENGVLRLANLSDDPWTVQMPGKSSVEPPVDQGSGVLLKSGVKITFRSGATGTIILMKQP